ncbi:MAG TPA: hypothetical protein VJ714_06980 [Anaerolineae bacterium]|nr:hypothetical protein [Anaerolineae bacterium]
MLLEDQLYLAANFSLFAAVLLGWLALRFPGIGMRRLSQGLLILFLAVQGVTLSWAAAAQGYATLASPEAASMVAVETAALLCLWGERFLGASIEVASALTLAFVVHSSGLVQMWLPTAGIVGPSPFVNAWFGLHLLTAAVTTGAYVCAAGGTLAWLARRAIHCIGNPGESKREPDAPLFSRWALMIAYPILTGSVMARGAWSYLAFGTCWSWHTAAVLLLALWLVLTITLHVTDGARWGIVRALLVLFGLLLAVLILPLLGQTVPAG